MRGFEQKKMSSFTMGEYSVDARAREHVHISSASAFGGPIVIPALREIHHHYFPPDPRTPEPSLRD